MSVRIADAIAASERLVELTERAAQSRARIACIRQAIPPELAEHVDGGPLDGRRWVILAKTPTVATKVRRCVQTLQGELAAQGFDVLPIRVHVAAPAQVGRSATPS